MDPQSAPDRVIARLAARQHGVVARRQLLDDGLTTDLIRLRLRGGRLLPVGRGVYAVGHEQLRPQGQWLAAVLSVGAEAVLSHGHAAACWDLQPEPGGPVRVLLPGRAGRVRRTGVRIYRPELYDAADVGVHDRIPVTTVGRTLLDLAGTTNPRELEQMVRRASRLRVFDLRDLQAVVDRHPRHRGARRVSALIARMDGRGTEDLRSVFEARFLKLCDDHDFPTPIVNGHVAGVRVDFHWPHARLVVETDGFEWHATPTQFSEDRRRDQRLMLAGYRVVRIAWDQLRDDAAGLVAMIATLLGRSRAASGR